MAMLLLDKNNNVYKIVGNVGTGYLCEVGSYDDSKKDYVFDQGVRFIIKEEDELYIDTSSYYIFHKQRIPFLEEETHETEWKFLRTTRITY